MEKIWRGCVSFVEMSVKVAFYEKIGFVEEKRCVKISCGTDQNHPNEHITVQMQMKIRLSLSYKLFAAFFLILLIVVGSMFLSRFIFSYNFQNYIKEVEIENLESLVPVLTALYNQNGSWDFVRRDPENWSRRLENQANLHRLPPPLFADASRTKQHRGESRLLMLDENELPLIGIPDQKDNSKIFSISSGDKVVGWLGIKQQKPFNDTPPGALLKRQAEHLTVLGILVIAVTVVIAVLFSRHILYPVRQLINGTHALANRDFSLRIPATTSDELGTLAENFNEMAGTLEEYEMLRKKWLTDISHELRTPLAILRGELEAIEDGVREASPESISSLHHEVLRISNLVEDLHLLSLAESDSLSMEKLPCSPRSILEDSVNYFQSRLAEKQIEIQLMLDDLAGFEISADQNRIEQVFFNLFDNSCKYIQEGGKLRISGSVKDTSCFIRFDDTGPGVSQKALPHLFDRLYREDHSRSRQTGGSGLGLTICRHIIEKHDGEIIAESSNLGGLAIIIRLPLILDSNA